MFLDRLMSRVNGVFSLDSGDPRSSEESQGVPGEFRGPGLHVNRTNYQCCLNIINLNSSTGTLNKISTDRVLF